MNNGFKLASKYYPNAITESRSLVAVAVRSVRKDEVLGRMIQM